MSASANDIIIIRGAIGDSAGTTFSDSEIQAYWADIEQIQANTRIIRQQVVVDLIDVLLADSSKRVSYKQNESSENMSDVFKHLLNLREVQAKKLEALLDSERGSARIAALRKVPRRRRDWPDA